MANVDLVIGDITGIECDALVTFVNPNGDWYGGVDKAIRRRAGNAFHELLAARRGTLGLPNGHPTMVHSFMQTPFRNVLFIVDDFSNPLPLWSLLYGALDFAEEHGFQHVTMPVFRTGAAGHLFDQESTEQELISTLLEHSFPGQISVVVYDDADQAERLMTLLGK